MRHAQICLKPSTISDDSCFSTSFNETIGNSLKNLVISKNYLCKFYFLIFFLFAQMSLNSDIFTNHFCMVSVFLNPSADKTDATKVVSYRMFLLNFMTKTDVFCCFL